MMNGSLEEDEADVFNFIARLRQENLFIRSERQDIQDLNKLITIKIHKVVKTSWLTNKQRFFLLEKRNRHFESITLQACENFDLLGTYKLDTDFVEAKNVLGSQNAINISNLLHILRSQPKQLAEWLLMGEKITEEREYRSIIQSVINGLYGSCIFAEDAKYMLTLLLEVAKQQLLGCDEPRSVIQKRTCTFRHLFFLFDEVYQPAKFFLSAALELPILDLLSFNQYYLDVDHDKSIQRFRSEDNLKTFREAVEYRNEVVARLGQFTNNFIQSMLENVYSFPKPIAWIACLIYKMIEKAFCAKEANAVTTELIFNTFIVPIIVDPEQYGIYNSQISDVARHNLVQIAKILQILALSKFEGIDKKYMDIFQTVDKNSMSNFIELLFFDMDGNEPPVEASPNIMRDIMLFTEEELHSLIDFFQKVQMQRNQNDNVEKNPTVTVTIEEHLSLLTVPSRNNSPRMNGDLNVENSPQKKTFFSLGTGVKNSKRSSDELKERPTVIVFPMDGVSFEPVGMLPEEKVIDLSVPVKTEAEIYTIPENMSSMKEINIVENGVQNCDVKSTYSNYQDEGSIGNTSDNLEAISEAASNHSVASSLELENEDQNDNLSDMVSANVSGRGTPNISGRDTPSSQVNENEDRQNVENRQENVEEARPPPSQISRQIRSEIDDKFCKFEIKKLLAGDETISLISETWSTDVLASDNETVDLSERMSFPMPLADQAIQEVPCERERENVLDVSETQSESAWSTDVMGSDTERLTEVDNDDAASVAQSDDTNSVPRSDDTRSETDEVAGLRRLSSCSSNYNNSAANQVPTSAQGYVANVSVNNINYVNVTSNSPSYVTANTTNFLTSIANVKSNESANFVSANQNYLAGSNFKKVEFDTRSGKSSTREVDSNANTIFKSVSQQTQTSVSYNGAITTTAFTDRTQVMSKTMDPNIAGPSGLYRNASLHESETSILKQNGVRKYENNRTNEILLSNCSLNSSSSGSSSNSFDNKNSMNELSNSDQWEPKPWLNSSGSSLNVTLTPSESTSELSVLSATNAMSQSCTTNGPGAITSSISRKTTTVLSKGLKATSSSGAIAKSISFDMSVEKGLDDDNRIKRGGFFGKIRNGFKTRRGKGGFRASDDFRNASGDYNRGDIGDSPVKHVNIADVPDDILAKYRSKDFIEGSPVKDGSREKKNVQNENRDSCVSDINTFSDIKKKLRLVLCNTSEVPYYLKRNPCSIKSKLETVLRLELGRARKLRDWSVVARISESLRCISLLDEKGCMKLIHSMKEDVMLRTTYIQYLIASKRELLFCQMYLDNLQEQIKHDKHQCEAYIATLCVREFLLQQEAIISEFYTEFSQLTLADEKYDLIQKLYRKLNAIMNDSGPWQDVLRKRGKVFEIILERYIISRVYANALYPNGDGDIDRDRVLHKHIENLSKVVTPEHKDLMIPRCFLRESPWLPAQDALRALNACRTPKDKLKCIKRCGRGIMDLLSISTGYPAADDFLPVLVYVIIKVNPEALLSTIQFVNSFQGQIKNGEEEYWWTGFCAAVEIIKNMDYSD